SVTREDIHEVAGRNDDLVGEAHGRCSTPPPREVIIGLAAPVVEDHGGAESPADEHRGKGSEQIRPVRGRERVNHIVRPKGAGEARYVRDRCRDRAHILYLLENAEAAWKSWVDREEVHIE